MKDTELITNDKPPSDISIAAQLPPDLMLLKMENESIMSVAQMRPRDPMSIVAQLKALVDAYPASADDAIYSKPVGTVIQCVCGNPKCKLQYEVNQIDNDTACPNCESTQIALQRKVKKFAEGLSIRAAESIRSIFGFTRMATTVQMLQDGSAKITGVLVDYAAGNVTSDERIVSPWYKAKGGKMMRTPDDRFLNVVVKAEKAKLRRDVILDSTPGIVKAMFYDYCEQKLQALVPPEVVEQKILPTLAEHGLTREMAEKLVGRSIGLGWREQERMAIRKILVALRDKETTVQELMDGLQDDGPAHPSASNTVTAASLTSGAPASGAKQPPRKPSAKSPPKQEQGKPEPEAKQESSELIAFRGLIARSQTIDEVREQFRISTDGLEQNGSYSADEIMELVSAFGDAADARINELKAKEKSNG